MPDADQLNPVIGADEPQPPSTSLPGQSAGPSGGRTRPSLKRVRVVAPTDLAGDNDGFDADSLERRKHVKLDDDDDNKFKPYAKKGSKHTLDSDEELEEDHAVLDIEEIEGQEEKTVEFDGNVKLTPFNMEDEMDEGHFDSEGNFIFTKNQDELKDAWMDGIDWDNVKAKAGKQWHKMAVQNNVDDDEDDLAPEITSAELLTIYENMLAILLPGESVAKALSRLGGKKNPNAERRERWKKKANLLLAQAGSVHDSKAPSTSNDSLAETTSPALSVAKDAVAAVATTQNTTVPSLSVDAGDNSMLLQLTELVDKLVSQAQFDAYSYTFERLRLLCDQLRPKISLNAVDEDLDMFAEGEVADTLSTVRCSEDKGSGVESKSTTEQNASVDVDGEIKWIFKWKNSEDAEVHGPMTSRQMLQWQEAGYFKNGVWVRQVGKESAPFYSGERIDFDLYV